MEASVVSGPKLQARISGDSGKGSAPQGSLTIATSVSNIPAKHKHAWEYNSEGLDSSNKWAVNSFRRRIRSGDKAVAGLAL